MRGRLLAAFAAVYIVWGSTYLAIRYAVATLPPLMMAGARFMIAGALIWLFTRMRSEIRPTRRDWITGAVSGALLLFGGNGGVVWAEQRVPSGITALLVAVVPLWMVLIEWWRPGGKRPHVLVFVGLALGLLGLALLVGPDALHGTASGVSALGGGVLILASLSWAAGSLYTKHAERASSSLNGVATQMIAGGTWLFVTGMLAGEMRGFDLSHVSRASLIGFAYLVTFGSLVGFTSYFYVLAHTTAAKAATYAYVNPVVAVFLGWAIAHEPVTARTILAAAVILGGVAIITLARERPALAVSSQRAAA